MLKTAASACRTREVLAAGSVLRAPSTQSYSQVPRAIFIVWIAPSSRAHGRARARSSVHLGDQTRHLRWCWTFTCLMMRKVTSASIRCQGSRDGDQRWDQTSPRSIMAVLTSPVPISQEACEIVYENIWFCWSRDVTDVLAEVIPFQNGDLTYTVKVRERN